MNERIEHCLYQAGLTANGCWDELGTYEQEAIEKFAELIVKECGVALSPMLRDMVSRSQAFDLIKKHFGIEE